MRCWWVFVLPFLSHQLTSGGLNDASKDYYSILGVTKDAIDADIRRAYRKLALEFHPDKIRPKVESEKEIENKKNRFLDIQEAYDRIGSSEKRIRYNLEQSGQVSEHVDERVERFKMNPFSIFARTNQISFAFSIKYSKPKLKPIQITVYMDIRAVFQGASGSHTYFRNHICDSCQGNGGVNGTCRKCSLCDGSGHCNHIFHDHSYGYIHTTGTTCGRCKGKGCVPEGKCSSCSGTGIVTQEAVLFYELQPGFPNSFLIVYEELGHMNADGRKGDVEVTFLHQYPTGWRRRENSLDLFFTMPVQLENLANGWSTSLNCVNGKTFEVNIEGQSLIEILENGVSIVVPDYGLIIDNAGSKGDLLIEISPSWENMTLPLWIELLQASDIDPDNPYFKPLMRVYFSYADDPPDLEDILVLRSSYPSFNWSQTVTLDGGVLHEKFEDVISPDDIVVKNVEPSQEVPSQGS